MEQPKEKSFLEKTKDNLPLLSIALITLSTARLISYYHYFGIDITSYIELTEAITLSTPIFIYYTLLLILGAFGGILGVRIHSNNTPSADIQATKNFIQRIRQFTSPASFFLLFIVIPLITIWLVIDTWQKGQSEYIETIVSVMLILLSSFTLDIFGNELWLKLREYRENISLHTSTNILRAANTVAIIMMSTRMNAYHVVYGGYNERNQVKFTIGNKIVQTTDKYRYVGRTKNYLFLYNVINGYADIYKLT
jgi:hypothetical protein